MKKTVIVCDNCGTRCDSGAYVMRIVDVTYDICTDCVEGNFDLGGLKFKDWPNWVPREAVERQIERLQTDLDAAREQARSLAKHAAHLDGEINRVRNQALTALHEGRTPTEQIIRDIVSGAKR